MTAFIDAIERQDLDAALDLVAQDLEYENVPISVVRGKDNVRQALEPLLVGASEVQWQVLAQVASKGVVLNERLDRFRMGDHWIEVRVAGVFHVSDDRISVWRDYFDLEQFTSQLPGVG